jgi:hypothetical protein
MSERGCEVALGKNRMCCSYQNRNPDISERRRNTIISFIIVVIPDFRLIGLDFDLLSSHDKRYKIMQQR